ncbi:MAG: hypothetical protein R3327_05125 [Nitrosopumilaceae archaeon]|nr:hypothetical protein [Nitrosopumilaceae archaeon]
MATKKGKIITIGILAAITLVSFVFWFIPQGSELSLVVSDYENYLDGVKNIHSVLEQEIDGAFQDLRNGNISPQEYKSMAQTTSDQVTEQISQLVTTKPSEQWQQSYINYMDALRKFNSQIRETIVYADTMNQETEGKLSEILEKIEKLEKESQNLVNQSDSNRPQ